MPEGFFSAAAIGVSEVPPSLLPRCGSCGLSKSCKTPFMLPSGKGGRKILLVGEAPGDLEDERGQQFVGEHGQFLASTIQSLGFKMRKDCILTNALVCRPPDDKITNSKAVEYCRPNLLKAIQEYKPHVIVPLGGTAIKSVIGWLWKKNPGNVFRWEGWRIPSQKLNAWICPTFHPKDVFSYKEGSLEADVLKLFFRQHIQAAFALDGKPWEEVPDYPSQVQIFVNSDEALPHLATIIGRGKPTAIDIETNMIKPDSSRAAIVSCSLSNGETTISFPWKGKVINKVKEFLVSPVPKIGYNMKFEIRWFLKFLGVLGENWLHCGMTFAHILDNRKDITGLKFQSFALFGLGSYNEEVEPYLSSAEKGGNEENRIFELVREQGWEKLLLYGDMDALLEFMVWKKHKKELSRGE